MFTAPQVFPAFASLLLSIFTGANTAPQYIYMGLSSGGADVSADDGGSPPVSSGYARKKIAVSSLGVSNGTLIVPVQTWTFLCQPFNNGADRWFVTDDPVKYSFYFSGPLNPGTVSDILPIGANAGASTLTLPTATAIKLMQYDKLVLGSCCANNLEYVGIGEIGIDNNGLTVMPCNRLQYTHPVSEAFTRYGSARYYSAGFIETVSAQVILTTQTC